MPLVLSLKAGEEGEVRVPALVCCYCCNWGGLASPIPRALILAIMADPSLGQVYPHNWNGLRILSRAENLLSRPYWPRKAQDWTRHGQSWRVMWDRGLKCGQLLLMP